MIKKSRPYCCIGGFILVGLLLARKSFCRGAGVSFYPEGSYIEYRFARTELSQGASFYLGFASSLCEGDLLLVTNRGNADNFYRFSLEKMGALNFHYRLTDGDFNVQLQEDGINFCDGKKYHVEVHHLYRSVTYRVEGRLEHVHSERRIKTLVFGKPDRIILGGREGKKFTGIIYNATVAIRWSNQRVSSIPLIQKYFGNDTAVRSAGLIGIAAEYSANLQSECISNNHIRLTDSSGIISSPSSSKKPWNMTSFCSWTISAPVGRRLKLTLLHFNIKSSRTCFDTYLEVFDGSYSNAPLLVRYCNPNRIKVRSNDQSIRFSSGRHMMLRLFIGNTTEAEVMVFYKAVGLDKGPCPTNARLEGTSGEITSPDFPYHYDNKKTCSWIITAPKGYHVLLTFLPGDFHVQSGCSTSCQCGYLEARGGGSKESKLLGKYCGAFVPSPIYSWHRHMWLGFVAHSEASHKGFRATYSIIESLKDECPRDKKDVQFTTHGNISSPRFPLKYPGNMECFWRIKVAEKRRIKVEFNTPIYLDSNCTDYVEIQSGGNTDRFCTSFSIPPSFYSHGNELLLVFHSDGYRKIEGQGISGFSVRYLDVPVPSGTGFSTTISAKEMVFNVMVGLFVCYLHNT